MKKKSVYNDLTNYQKKDLIKVEIIQAIFHPIYIGYCYFNIDAYDKRAREHTLVSSDICCTPSVPNKSKSHLNHGQNRELAT
jgi:hypothetical protein